MSVLNKIAYYQKRRDEVPNKELALELAATKDKLHKPEHIAQCGRLISHTLTG